MSTKPLYEQLADKLTRYIRDGRLKPGDRLPTEAELGEMFGVSRITVRQGLAILTRNGLIERFASRGTFVLERKNTGSWELGSINDLVQLGKDTTTKIASWSLVPPPAEIAEFFASHGTASRVSLDPGTGHAVAGRYGNPDKGRKGIRTGLRKPA